MNKIQRINLLKKIIGSLIIIMIILLGQNKVYAESNIIQKFKSFISVFASANNDLKEWNISDNVKTIEDKDSVVETYAVENNKTSEVYTITLDNDGGKGETTKLYVISGKGVYLDSSCTKKMTPEENGIEIPTKEGYIFEGYYFENRVKGIEETGYIYDAFYHDPTLSEEATLKAKWTEKKSDDTTDKKDPSTDITEKKDPSTDTTEKKEPSTDTLKKQDKSSESNVQKPVSNSQKGNYTETTATKILPKTGYQIELLVGIVIVGGLAIICYKKSKIY